MRQFWLALSVAAATATGLDLAGIDRSVAPGDDFFRHANGTWLASTEIPADRASYGPGAIVAELTTERTAELVQQAAKSGAAEGSAAQRVGDYYASLADQAAIDGKGLAPIQPRLDRIAKVADRCSLSQVLGEALRADVDVLNATNLDTDNLLGLWVAQDLDDPTRYAAFLLQGGLDMPDREYYLDASPRMAEIRAKFQAHVARVLELGHVSDAAARAARIADLEHRMAEVHASREESADVRKGNNHWSRAQLDSLAPGLDWTAYLDAAGLGKQAGFVVWQPRAVTGLSALVASQPLDTWKDYLSFHALEHVATVLPAAFGEERFAFHGSVLAGTPQRREALEACDRRHERRPRRRRRPAVRRAVLPARGQGPHRLHGPEPHEAFGRRIDAPRLDGAGHEGAGEGEARGAEGRRRLSRPLARLHRRCASSAATRSATRERAEAFELQRNLAKLGRPVDRSEWVMTPQTVNAVNLPVRTRSTSRRPSCSRRSSTPRAPWRWTTARSGRSSATRSATASTTRARSSTPPAGCGTGGRRPTGRTSRPRPRGS